MNSILNTRKSTGSILAVLALLLTAMLAAGLSLSVAPGRSSAGPKAGFSLAAASGDSRKYNPEPRVRFAPLGGRRTPAALEGRKTPAALNGRRTPAALEGRKTPAASASQGAPMTLADGLVLLGLAALLLAPNRKARPLGS